MARVTREYGGSGIHVIRVTREHPGSGLDVSGGYSRVTGVSVERVPGMLWSTPSFGYRFRGMLASFPGSHSLQCSGTEDPGAFTLSQAAALRSCYLLAAGDKGAGQR
jgi:hypothetical protein